jgi:hypothetical protein
LKNLTKSKINTHKTQNLLKNIEERILKEKQIKQNIQEVDKIKLDEKNNLMTIDDERQSNENQKMTSTEFNINNISFEQNVSNDILFNQQSQESKIDIPDNNNKDSSSKDNDTIHFGQKRTFQQFSSQAYWEIPMSNKSSNLNNMINLSNNSLKKFGNSTVNTSNSFDKNLQGLSVKEIPFDPKKPNSSIDKTLFNRKEPQYNQSNELLSEFYNTTENFNNSNKNVSQNKKTILFKNNFNSFLPLNNNNLTLLNSNLFSPSNNINYDIQPNINPYMHNRSYFNFTNNEKSNSIEYPLHDKMSIHNFGSYNNPLLGTKQSFNEEKDTFSKAVINNKIYTEDNNDFIQVGPQQSKKPNYRKGLFEKEDNSSSNILNNNFGNIPSHQKRPNIGTNIKDDEASEGDEKENKEYTDDDQEEIRIIDETLQIYLDEDKVINDKKLKISVIRKIAPYYKVLTQQNNKQHFVDKVEKINTIINEDKNDIIILLNYEYLKNFREKVFQKFCKMINKFFFKLNENKVKEFGGENYNMEIPETLKERLKNIYTKINDYFDKNKELE